MVGLAGLPSPLRSLLEEWFDWKAGDEYAPHRVPWYRHGWQPEAAAWIEEQVRGLGDRLVAPVEQLRSWQRSALLRAHTPSGALYFKAVPPMFAHEPRLIQALARDHPGRFPEIIALDEERHWYLMRDLGGRPLTEVRDIGRWEEALRCYARLQIAATEEVERLLALGCPDRRLDRLAAELDSLLEDTRALQPAGLPLSAEEIQHLRRRAPWFKEACAELAAAGIPCTLEHGDFWSGQIIVGEKGHAFIDWSDSSVSHPFFSMLFLRENAGEFPEVPDVGVRLRNAYLEPWTDYAPMDRLVSIYEQALVLAGLHHALLYHRIVLPGMEVRWEMENMVPYYLKTVLEKARGTAVS